MAAERFHPAQRCQALLAGHWHLAQFVTYAVIDGREQAIVRTGRTLGKPGLLSYLDVRDVRRVEFDAAGNPILGDNGKRDPSLSTVHCPLSFVPPLFYCGLEYSV